MNNGQLPERSPHFAVHEYPFMVADVVRLQLPKGARIRHVAQPTLGRSDLRLWAQIDKRQPMVERVLLVYGTNAHMPPEPGKFLSTVIVNGVIVWHIYDAGEVP